MTTFFLEFLTLTLFFFTGYIAFHIGCALNDYCAAANGML
jgi:4-hydroxybenzoate polyprenyltransferase